MSDIDEKIVQMKFDNEQFEGNVQTTLDSLDSLKQGLNLDDQADSLNNLQSVADSFDLSNIADSVGSIADQFTALGVIGVTALANITTKVIDAGSALVKSFSTDLIGEGFNNYETQINAVQTILSNTAASGTGLKQVTAALNQLNVYANKTVYNFADMAKNIGTFTAAGVNLKTSVSSIKGIANLAALSGSSAEQASGAMYQLSQAIAQGKVRLQDWNSVVNAGLGGKVFQKALVDTARAHGVAVDSMIKKEGGFRNSLQKNWLTSKILTDTLKQFTGDLNKTQLKNMGFSAKQAAAILKVGKGAVNAATQIKTVTQLTSALKEEVGTAWAAVDKTIFGNINQAKAILSPLHTEIENDLTNPIYAVNKALQTWSQMGGRAEVIKALGNAFQFLKAVVAPVKRAFADIFPNTLAFDLIAMSNNILKFSEGLKVSGSVGNDIFRTFKGLFALLDIGRQIIVGALKMVGNLFGQFAGGTGSVLDVTAGIGDFLVKVDKAIKSGDGLTKFFDTLGKIIAVPLGFLETIVGVLGQFVSKLSGFKSAAFGDDFSKLGKSLSPFNAALDLVQKAFGRIGVAAGAVFKFLKPVITAIGDFFANLGGQISSGVQNIKWDDVLSGVQAGFFGALTILVAKFIKGGKKGAGSGLLGSLGLDTLLGPLKEVFEGLTGALEAMQQNLKANVLLKIAGAIGIMTLAVVALSMIDSKRLAASMTAITVMMTELGAAMKIFSGLNAAGGLKGTAAVSLAMISMGIAIDILANAVTKLAKLDWNELARGLTGMVVILASVIATSKLLGTSEQANLVKVGIAMVPFALGLDIMAAALKNMGNLSWEEMAKGLSGFATTLGGFLLISKVAGKIDGSAVLKAVGSIALMAGAILLMSLALRAMSGVDPVAALAGMGGITLAILGLTYALKLMPETVLLKSALALVVMAAAVDVLAGALKTMGDMSMGGVGKALLLLGGSLIILVASLTLMGDPLVLLGSAALLVASAALLILAPALAAMGAMDMDTIGKALGVLAASLIIIALSLTAMIAALPGAAALLVASAALAILAPVLALLGSLPLQAIGTALLAIAGVFVVLGVGAVALAVVVPILIALGLAVSLLGLGALAAGVGVLALAVGLTMLGAVGAAGMTIIIAAIQQFLDAVPGMADSFGTALTSMANAIGNSAPSMVNAGAKIISALLDGIDKVGPKIIKTATDLISKFLDAVGVLIPKMYTTGLKILSGILSGIAANIGKMADKGTAIVVNFLDAIGRDLPKIITAGVHMIINFVNGLANGIRQNTKAMNAAGMNLAEAIIEGMTSGLQLGFNVLVAAATNIAKGVLDTVKFLLGIHSPSKEFIKIGQFVNEGFVIGLTSTSDKVQATFDSYKQMVSDLVTSTADDVKTYQDKIGTLTDKIGKDSDAITKQRAAVAKAQADRKSGVAVDQDTVRIGQLTAARAKDEAAIKKYAAAAKASYKKDGDAKRAQARLDLRSAQASLASNAEAIKEAKNKLKADRSDIKHGTTVAAAQKKLQALLDTRTDDNNALKDANTALLAAQDEQGKANAATDQLNGTLADQESQLGELAIQNDSLTDTIKTQTQAVTDATKTRDDYNQSITDSYDAMAAIGSDTTVSDYFTNLEDQVTKVNEYATALQTLRSRGLDDTNYKKLLSAGTDALPFVTDLLNQGYDGIAEFNSLDTQLTAAASGLGSTASTNLYQAGVDSAQGLLDGYNSQQATIQAQMQSLATSMLDAVKSALGIHSPSKEFAKVGGYSVDGLVKGLTTSTSSATSAASAVGDSTLTALKKSMAGVASAVATDMDLQPTITPILDLSSIKQGASQIGGMLNGPALSVDSAYASATTASAGVEANQQAILDAKSQVATDQPAGDTVFNQYNNSPKALSRSEIYRQTKNQLSQAKNGG